MMNYWKARTARERLLISIAAGLAASVILLLVIWLPALQARKSAQLGAERAAKTLEAISRQSPIQASDNGSGTGLNDPDAIRRVVLEAASSRGLTIVRVLVDEQASVVVQVDDAPASTVFDWLLDIQRNSYARIRRASMNDSGNGFVRSSFEFSGTPDE